MSIDKRLQTKRGIEHIKSYILDPTGDVDLTDKEKQLIDDLRYLDKQMMNFESAKVVVSNYVDLCKKEGRPITTATAYNRLNYMKRVFGPLYRENKDYTRALMAQWIHKVMVRADKANDFKSFAQLFKQYKELLQLDQPDEVPLEVLLNPIPFEFGYMPDLETRQMDPAKRQALEEKYLKKYSEEIPFEDMTTKDQDHDG